jgi:hypothetical protein
LFYADDLPKSAPKDFRALKTYVRQEFADTSSPSRVMLYSRREFVDKVLWPAVAWVKQPPADRADPARRVLILGRWLQSSKGLGPYGEGYTVAGTIPDLTILEEIKDHPSGWNGRLTAGSLEWSA